MNLKENISKEESLDGLHSNFSILNLGPTHPATHGVFQNILKMDGETIIEATPTVGYIHRAFEKLAEHRNFTQINTITDRLNYCSSPINNIGWQITVEKFFGIEIPKRIDYLRVIIMELARIADHLVCNSVIGVDTGALTGFVYVFEEREAIYQIFEEVCGSRLTTNIGRIGGFERNFSTTAFEKINRLLEKLPKTMKEFETLFDRNRIFMDRTMKVGGITAERALNYSFTGPNLRAAGVDFDVRVSHPYCSYQDFEFTVPVGSTGDVYDRYMVRNAEIWESLSIIKQAMQKIDALEKEDPLQKEVFFSKHAEKFHIPEKADLKNSMEALINHFKIIMGEIDVPKGEIYNAVEGANGEVGYYMVSDGGRTPYRLHFRRPGFIYYQAYPEIVKNTLLSDAVVTMSSMNLIAGEMDA